MTGARRCVTVALALIALVLGAWVRAARADPPPPGSDDVVALLPLDAERSLEIYGQPVASEIARALAAGHVQVVVVGPRMHVPERARLIIDGTIVAAKSGALTISLRIRDPGTGASIDSVVATASGLARIDAAAAELSSRVLPIVRERFAASHRAAESTPGPAAIPPAAIAPAAAAERSVLIALARDPTAPDGPLFAALDAELPSWMRTQQRRILKIDADRLDARRAAATVTAAHGDLAIGFWIVGWQVETVPAAEPGAHALEMARARVRVRISDASAVVFDRVVATDTVIGDPGLSRTALAARLAREVLAILRPHLRREVPSWR